MSRWKAAALHLGISLVVASIVASIIYFVWYPPPYFTVSGGSFLMLLIMSVDVVLGPCLTLAVFRSGKKGLKADLTVIAVLQLAAFWYGLSVIADARPVFVVAATDRFVPVAANQISDKDLAQGSAPQFRVRSWSGPLMVGAVAPPDKAYELAQSARAGRDIEKIPQYYVPFEQVQDALLQHARPLTELETRLPQEAERISRFAADHHAAAEDLSYVPLQGRARSATMVISTKTLHPVGTLSIDPW